MVADCGAQENDRWRSAARNTRCGGAGTETHRGRFGSGSERSFWNSRSTARVDVRVRASCDRSERAFAADFASRAWARRGEAEISSAFLVSPAAMADSDLCAQKRKFGKRGFRFAFRRKKSCQHRLDTVLDAIYAGFAEAWSDPAGTDVARRDLSEEAIYLGRVGCRTVAQ